MIKKQINNLDVLVKESKPQKEDLIIFVTGLMMNFELSVFFKTFEQENKYDFVTYDIYDGVTQKMLKKTLKDLDEDFELVLEHFSSKYKNIHIITYSFGSQVVLRAKLNKKVRSLTFWSPSFCVPQIFSSKLEEHRGFYNFANKKINKIFAKELDNLDTKKAITKKIINMCTFYVGTENKLDPWSKLGVNIIKIPFKHSYSKNDVIKLYNMTMLNLLSH